MNEKQKNYLLVSVLFSILVLYALVASLENRTAVRTSTVVYEYEPAQAANIWDALFWWWASQQDKDEYGKYKLAPGDYEYTIRHGGRNRYYDVRVPQNYNYKSETPVVIYLHGGGGDGSIAISSLGPFAEKYGFILVGPYGTNGNPWFPKRFLVWNGGEYTLPDGSKESCCGYASQNNIDDVGFIDAVIRDLSGKANVDENRIYATGISNGGRMAFRIACELGGKIAAIAPVAPGTYADSCDGVQVPSMIIHGTGDLVLPYEGGKAKDVFLTGERSTVFPVEEIIADLTENNNCTDQTVTTYSKGSAICVAYQGCSAPLTFCPVVGMGHTWPSGDQYLPSWYIGPVSYDMSFDQMWEFFEKQGK